MKKSFQKFTKFGVVLMLTLGLIVKVGCDIGFLGLQDYQRDLLVGGLLTGVLLSDDGGTDPGATQGVPGSAGSAGADGEAGRPGPAGADGEQGDAGVLGSAGPQGPEGPTGPDGAQGPEGPRGPIGSRGADGASGPAFFTIFVDDFFALEGNPTGDLQVNDDTLVSISEPVLGSVDTLTAVAYRVAIPQIYDVGNDVTMRLFFQRTGDFNGSCFVFTLDAARLQPGTSVEPYGDTVWVRVDGSTNGGAGVFVDLVINSPAGLDYPDDLVISDFLAFELNTIQSDGGLYHLLGVEFYEFDDNSAQSANATFFRTGDEVECECECPDNIVADCKTPNGAVVEYEKPSADGCSELCPVDGPRLNLYSVAARDGVLRVVDEHSASTMEEVLMTLPGEQLQCVVSGTGLATHPATGELWALLKVQQVGECLDETRTVFAGCPEGVSDEARGGPQFDDRCRRFNGDQERCEMAYALGSDSVTSCIYDEPSGQCFSCGRSGPRGNGTPCVNTCVPEPDCVDDSRTTFLGGPNTAACRFFDNDQSACEQSFAMSGNGVVSCFWDGQSCRGCGSNNANSGNCTNTCRAIPECEDESRTIFAGFPGSGGCQRFGGDPEGCALAYVEGDDGVASCWYDEQNQQCRGCGPRHQCEGNCQNTCDPGDTVPELVCAGDPSRTNFAGCPRSEGCRSISNQSDCEASFHLGGGGIGSCFWDEGDQECRGCGPNNDGCECENSCAVDDTGRGERPRGGKGRLLATVHPATGVVSPVGFTGDSFAGLAFGGDGTLYGVTGDGACKSESLHTLNKSTAEPTLLCKLGRGDDGEAIAYNSDDGFLYHASGHDGNCGDNGVERAGDGRGGGGPNDCVIFERIDATTGPSCATTDIDISSTALINEEAQALTYWSAEGVFLWKQDHNSFGPLFTVSADGEESEVGFMDHQAKGLAFTEGPACYVSCGPPSGSFFPVGQSRVECFAVPFDSPQRSQEGLICSFEVDVSDDCAECVCQDDVFGACQAFAGPVHGPDTKAVFATWLGHEGNNLIDFESVPLGSLKDELANEFGVHFRSVENPPTFSPQFLVDRHVVVHNGVPAALGQAISGTPSWGGCCGIDGRVIYQVTFDEPQRWAGLDRFFDLPFTVTQFFNGDNLLYEYTNSPCKPGFRTYFFGYVAPSNDTGTWVTRIVLTGTVRPGESANNRIVGSADNLFFGTQLGNDPGDGAFVCYDEPAVDEACLFTCLGDANGQTAGVQAACRVSCDPVWNSYFPTGATTVTCTAEVNVGDNVWEQSDECSFAVSVDTCVGEQPPN